MAINKHIHRRSAKIAKQNTNGSNSSADSHAGSTGNGGADDLHHNMQQPCCAWTKEIVHEIFFPESSSLCTESDSNIAPKSVSKKKVQTSARQCSCLSVMLRRHLIEDVRARKEQRAKNESGVAKKKKKKKKKSKGKKTENGDKHDQQHVSGSVAQDAPEPCCSVIAKCDGGDQAASDGMADAFEASTALAGKSSDASSGCDVGAVVSLESPPASVSSLMDSLLERHLSARESSTIAKPSLAGSELFPNRKLSDFLSTLVSDPIGGTGEKDALPSLASKKGGKRQGKGLGEKNPSLSSLSKDHEGAIVVGSLKDIGIQCDAIKCRRCKDAVKSLFYQFVEGRIRSVPICRQPFCFGSETSSNSRDMKHQTLASNLYVPTELVHNRVRTRTDVETESEVAEAFKYELMEEGVDTKFSLERSSSEASDKLLELSVVRTKSRASFPAKSVSEQIDLSSLVTIPSFTGMGLGSPAACLLDLVKSVILPLGHDPSTMPKNYVKSGRVSDVPSRVRWALMWKDETWSGDSSDLKQQVNHSDHLTMNPDAVRRLAELNCKSKEMGSKRLCALRANEELTLLRKAEVEQAESKREEFDVKQSTLMQSIDEGADEWLESLTKVLMAITAMSFSLFVPRQQRGTYRKCQEIVKRLWCKYEDSMTKFIEPSVIFRAEQMYSSTSHPLTPQLYDSPDLRDKMYTWLAEKIDIICDLHDAFDECFSAKVTETESAARTEIRATTCAEVICQLASDDELHVLNLEPVVKVVVSRRLSLVSRTIFKGRADEIKKEQDVKHDAVGATQNEFHRVVGDERQKLLKLTQKMGKQWKENRAVESWISQFENEWSLLTSRYDDAKKLLVSKLAALCKDQMNFTDGPSTLGSEVSNTNGSKRHTEAAHFVTKSCHRLEFESLATSIALKKWRLLSQFNSQRKHIKAFFETSDTLSNDRASDFCGGNRAAERRLVAIAASLVYRWFENRCKEWNAEETQKELLEGFSDVLLDNPSKDVGLNSKGKKSSSKKKKAKTASCKRQQQLSEFEAMSDSVSQIEEEPSQKLAAQVESNADFLEIKVQSRADVTGDVSSTIEDVKESVSEGALCDSEPPLCPNRDRFDFGSGADADAGSGINEGSDFPAGTEREREYSSGSYGDCGHLKVGCESGNDKENVETEKSVEKPRNHFSDERKEASTTMVDRPIEESNTFTVQELRVFDDRAAEEFLARRMEEMVTKSADRLPGGMEVGIVYL